MDFGTLREHSGEDWIAAAPIAAGIFVGLLGIGPQPGHREALSRRVERQGGAGVPLPIRLSSPGSFA